MTCRGQRFTSLILVAGAVWHVTGEHACAADPPGIVIDFWDAATLQYIGNPSLAILPNGDYVASHDGFGPGHSFAQVYFFSSQDEGETWSPLGSASGQYESTLFVHNSDLYLMGGGTSGGNEFVSIRKSTDGGASWTTPLDANTGRVFDNGSNINAGATQVIEHNGRIWRAMEEVDPSIPPGNSTNWRSFVLSAPVGADLLSASGWTASNSLLGDDFLPARGWYEGGVVVTPQGDPQVMLRTALMGEFAALLDVSADGSILSYDAQSAVVDFQGGANGKFTVRFDEITGRYWSLVNDHPNPGDVRNVLSLASSANLTDWQIEAPILSHPDPVNVGFQYADFQFDGNDIVFVSRTAFDGAANFHDANYLTFHRIQNYAALSSVQSVTLDVAADAEITNWGNWIDGARGELTQTGFPDYGGTLRAADDNFPTGAWAGEDNFGWVLMKWDLSSLETSDNSRLVGDVDLRMIQFDGAVGEVEVYQINSGAWDEATVTWNNWVGGTVGDEDITFLGTMTSTSQAGGGNGVTLFSDDDLQTLVQAWIDGTQDNHGILLKWPTGDPTNGDTFASRESTTDDPPQLIIDLIDLQSADFDRDLQVNGNDFLTWQRGLNRFPLGNATKADGDADGDGFVTSADLALWEIQYGMALPLSALASALPVPEPAAMWLAIVNTLLISAQRNRASSRHET